MFLFVKYIGHLEIKRPKFNSNISITIINKEVKMKNLEPNEPFYLISQAAKLLGITSDRLRTYEEEGLIKPYRTKHSIDGKRLFSKNDIEWLTIIRDLIKLGVSIPAIRVLLFSKIADNSFMLKEKDFEIINLVKKLQKHSIYQTFKIKD